MHVFKNFYCVLYILCIGRRYKCTKRRVCGRIRRKPHRRRPRFHAGMLLLFVHELILYLCILCSEEVLQSQVSMQSGLQEVPKVSHLELSQDCLPQHKNMEVLLKLVSDMNSYTPIINNTVDYYGLAVA